MGDRFDAFLADDVVKNIRKKHGASIFKTAADYKFQKVSRVPTGVFFLDSALGGGLPVGRVITFYGKKSTGKTALCLRSLGQFQKRCANCFGLASVDKKGVVACGCGNYREPICVYLDVEGTAWDADWARVMGVDPKNMLLSTPDYAEQALDIAEAFLRGGVVDLLVIDSLAFMSPSKEIEESTQKALQAEQARVIGRGIRKFVSAFNKCENEYGRRPTLILTNQIRMKVGVMFGSPETTSAGLAPGFAASVEVKTTGGKYSMDDITGRPEYVDFEFKVEKNKTFGAKINGGWRLMLKDVGARKLGNVADEEALIATAVRLGFMSKEGNGWKVLGERYRAKSLVTKQLIEDAAFKSKFEQALMAVLVAP
jgi:recombination protein RecA